MSQLSLLWEGAPYQKHSAESAAAALEILRSAHTLRLKVYEHIRSCGERGATDDEVQVALDMNPSTQRPRRVELWDRNVIAKLDGVTRKTRTGRRASVWVALEVNRGKGR